MGHESCNDRTYGDRCAAAAFIMRKRRMEPVKKMPYAELTIQWKEICPNWEAWKARHMQVQTSLHRKP
jgi:hypothetical protein